MVQRPFLNVGQVILLHEESHDLVEALEGVPFNHTYLIEGHGQLVQTCERLEGIVLEDGDWLVLDLRCPNG